MRHREDHLDQAKWFGPAAPSTPSLIGGSGAGGAPGVRMVQAWGLAGGWSLKPNQSLDISCRPVRLAEGWRKVMAVHV